jgi:hypothetical protein
VNQASTQIIDHAENNLLPNEPIKWFGQESRNIIVNSITNVRTYRLHISVSSQLPLPSTRSPCAITRHFVYVSLWLYMVYRLALCRYVPNTGRTKSWGFKISQAITLTSETTIIIVLLPCAQHHKNNNDSHIEGYHFQYMSSRVFNVKVQY